MRCEMVFNPGLVVDGEKLLHIIECTVAEMQEAFPQVE